MSTSLELFIYEKQKKKKTEYISTRFGICAWEFTGGIGRLVITIEMLMSI